MDWVELFRDRLEWLHRILEPIELPRFLGFEYLSMLALDAGVGVDAWRRIAPWIPAILASGLEREELRRFWNAWDSWDLSMSVLRYLSTNQGRIEVPDGALGDKLWLLPDWQDSRSERVDLFRADGAPIVGRMAELSSTDRVERPDRSDKDSDSALFFRWPTEIPPRGHEVLLWLRVRRLRQGCQFRLTSEDERDSTPLQVRLWHPRLRFGGGDRYEGIIAAVVPSELLPDAGERIRIEVENILLDKETRAQVHEVGVIWRPRGRLPVPMKVHRR